MPKSPMTTGTSPTPSISSVMPNVKRVVPETVSVPIVPTMIPKQAIISALIMEVDARKVRTTIPRHMREKYSGGPNRRAIVRKGRSQGVKTEDAQRSCDKRAKG